MTSKTLIRGGCVLTLGAKTPNYAEADVLIEDGLIAEVGPGLRARDAEQVDARDTIVMPGFVDAHRHVWKSLFRNLGESWSPAGAPMSPIDYGPHYRADDVYAATLIGLLGAIEAGITTVVDWADINPEAGHLDAAWDAHNDAGLRTVFVHSLPAWSGGPEEAKAGLRRLAARAANSASPMTTIAFGSREPARSESGRVGRDWSHARELSMRIHAHVGSDTARGGAVSELAHAGLLADDVTFVHCAHLDDADLAAIADSGASVVLTPSTEMAGQLGMPPLQGFLDRDIQPALGIDDEQMAPGDIFAQMRATNSVQHAAYFDLKLAGKAGLPNLLTTRDVIRFATLGGARAAGLDGETGTLDPGKQADLIVLRTDRPNIFPINDPIGAVVWGMDSSNVDWVFTRGRALMRNGVLEGDIARARELALTAQRRVASKVGLLADSATRDTA